MKLDHLICSSILALSATFALGAPTNSTEQTTAAVGQIATTPWDPTAVLWEAKLGIHQYSIPTIDRGHIYLTSDDSAVRQPGYQRTGGGVLLCVEQATGKLVWELPSPRYIEGVRPPYHFDQWKCGICSQQTVDGDRLFVVGNRGEVLCVDRNNGSVMWRYNLLKELGVVPHDVCGSTPLVVSNLVFACTSNGLDDRHDKVPAPLAPTLVALDKETGRLIARDEEGIGQRLLHCNWSSPVAGTVGARTLVFFGGGDGILYAFETPSAGSDRNAQGLKKVWSYDCNPPDYRTRDGVPIPHSTDRNLRPDGPSEIIGVPAFSQGRVYVAIGQSPLYGDGQGCLSCVDAATGRKLWDSKLVGRSLATPSVVDGLAYIVDTTGNAHCFDALTGQRCWVHPLGGRAWFASPFVFDRKVYVSNETGTLWTLKAERKLEVLSKRRLPSPPITLTAVGKVLYIPTQRSLLAVALAQGD
jgi:outer membrane protein assembly factor BamB